MPLLEKYVHILTAARVRERALFPPQRILSELELQARWFAGDFGKHFVTLTGQKIDIVQFGVWNREAGPDFSDAAIRVNGSEPMRGSIEFDLTDRNWESHGHATNPAFEDTVLHVFVHLSERTFFARTRSNREVRQVRADPNTLAETLSANIPLACPGRCQAPLRNLPEDRVGRVLDAAAQFRLQKKAARIRSTIDNHGRDEALFQEIAAALGYKQNKLPFTLLAQRLPLKLLRANSTEAEAMLFGVAGFLQAPDLDVYERPARKYVRELWDRWWLHRDALQRLILPAKIWRFSGARPLNHPQRRLAALAAISKKWPAFIKSLGKTSARSAEQFFFTLAHPFWDFHYTLASPASPEAMAIVGETRAAEILANVVFPFFVAEGRDVWNEFSKLPARLSNRRLATAATRLFGDDAKRGQFLKSVTHQQGLLQIYEDFCMQDNSDCTQCPFPEQMRKWT